ncbi:ATP10 protein-domain-containing protein [Crucibulum laeve]|uniref:ATP10 protein-domain-containing protein n=1 Tax=Crucibulum laeve TaxID=68775 RepID=A0A5C3M0B4_9AGAR|nr:ATP10 protein-domain-containing protein [Crucibulum laeve]
MSFAVFSSCSPHSFVRYSQQLVCLKRTLYATNTRWKQAVDTKDKPQPATPEQPESHIKASDFEVPDVKPNVLPPLNRPLGVRERPTTLIKSRTQKMKDLMDKDIRMAQRRHLIKEASKGYFHDMNMTRKHGGKTWIAPSVLIREDKALYLPNIVGKSLDNGTIKNTTTLCYGRITVLAMLGTQISEIHAKSFVGPTHARFSSNSLYQYIQINLQENILKSFLVSLFANKLRTTVAPEMQPNYLVSSQNMEYVRDPLGMTNSKVGYVYLIDENLKIRWGGSADARPEETQALESCTGVLLKRLEKTKPPKSQPVQQTTMEKVKKA